MAALTKDRLLSRARSGDFREPPVKAGVKIYAGAMVAIDATGFAVPASTSTTLKVIGRAEHQVDNTTGANGDKRVRTSAYIHSWANSAAGDLVARTDIGNVCYAVDDQTVAKTNGTNTRSAAGSIFDVDDDGTVWVKHS